MITCSDYDIALGSRILGVSTLRGGMRLYKYIARIFDDGRNRLQLSRTGEEVTEGAAAQDSITGSRAAAPGRREASSGLAQCRVCGDPLRPHLPVVRDSRTGEVFSIRKCPRCGLGYTLPAPSDMSKYYRDYYGGRHGFTGSFCTRRRMRILQKLAGHARAKRLLDIGCGEGTFLLAAKANGWCVAGAEMNPAATRARAV